MCEAEIHLLGPVVLEIHPLPGDGYVLDIGGGGEGVIGRLEGRRVVAIDCRKDELAEAPTGPLKIVMDARELKFLDDTFAAAAAFFSFMYLDEEADLRAALAEAFRVLQPGGCLYIWDVDLPVLPNTEKPLFAVGVRYIVNGVAAETAYGRPWPKQGRDNHYYRSLAEGVGFAHLATEVLDPVFRSTFRKI